MGWRKGLHFTAYYVTCEICKETFKTTPTSSKQKTCSKKCATQRIRNARIKSTCAICQKSITSAKGRIRKFCSNACRFKALVGQAKKITEARSTWGEWKNRKSAKLWFVNKYKGCMKCGYNAVPQILELHHIDRNGKNNVKSNLMLLCPNCHSEDHWARRDGQFANNKGRYAINSEGR